MSEKGNEKITSWQIGKLWRLMECAGIKAFTNTFRMAVNNYSHYLNKLREGKKYPKKTKDG